MSDASALYQKLILQHHREPHNCGELPKPTLREEGHNPLCGDQVVVTVLLTEGRLSSVRCEAKGCALCRASASLMTLALEGLSVGAAQAKVVNFEKALRRPISGDSNEPLVEEELSALWAVRAVPSRIGCVTLAWETLERGLARSEATVPSTS